MTVPLIPLARFSVGKPPKTANGEKRHMKDNVIQKRAQKRLTRRISIEEERPMLIIAFKRDDAEKEDWSE